MPRAGQVIKQHGNPLALNETKQAETEGVLLAPGDVTRCFFRSKEDTKRDLDRLERSYEAGQVWIEHVIYPSIHLFIYRLIYLMALRWFEVEEHLYTFI